MSNPQPEGTNISETVSNGVDVLTFAELDRSSVTVVGGKGAHLAERSQNFTGLDAGHPSGVG